uniref:snFPITE-n2 A chain n=1 Tax=Sipunculus nudus TaxID=6446 RepID=UPI003B98814E
IVGGQDATRGMFPYQLSLQHMGLLWYHTCGAVLLGANKALTAAHCTEGRAGFQVLAGAHVLSAGDQEQSSKVVTVTEHPDFDRFALGIPNDVATMALETAINAAGNVGYATLAVANAPDFAGDQARLSGWGKLLGADDLIADTLQYVVTTIRSTADCNSRMPEHIQFVMDQHICVHSDAGDTGSCQGDSGGPMTHGASGSGNVIGVTSWGIGNAFESCLPDYPSVYARVSYFRAWIDAN